MKKFFLITFLSYSLLLSMEIIDKQTIINYMKEAKKYVVILSIKKPKIDNERKIIMKKLWLFFLILNISWHAVAAEKQNWIFVTEMPEKKEQKAEFWQITVDHKFEIAGNEIVPVLYTNTFNEMIKEAKDKNVPFFLVLLTSKDEKGNDVMNVYEGKEAFKFLMEKWKTSDWLNTRLLIEHPNYPRTAAAHYLPAYFADPLNNLHVSNITIFVLGDDNKFVLLNDNIDILDLPTFVYLEKKPHIEYIGGTPTMIYNYEPKDILSKKGEAQLFLLPTYSSKMQSQI